MMLLRRFMHHVTEQNWFAVWIDLLVVVIGIFLGLQVTDWNEARRDRVTEHQYIERLLQTTKENIALLEEAKSLHFKLKESHIKTLRLLNQQSISADEREFLNTNLTQIMVWRNIDLNTGFVESLLSSGEWRIIRSGVLQEQLPGVNAEARALNRQLDFFRSWATAIMPEFIRKVAFSLDIEMLSTFGDIDMTSVTASERSFLAFQTGVSDEELLSPDMRAMVSTMLATRSNFLSSIEKTLQKAINLREILREEIGGGAKK
jgi:hypothetical protein